MGGRGDPLAIERCFSRRLSFSSPASQRPGPAADVWRCLAMDLKSIHRVSRIPPRSGVGRRVQRQVHVQSVGLAGWLLRNPAQPYPCHLPQLFPGPYAMAIQRTEVSPMIARELVTLPSYAEEVAGGLASQPKTLPCKLFYDATGSALFEEITRLPEYYLTRTELEILR